MSHFVEQGNNFQVFPRCRGSAYKNLKVRLDFFELNGTVFFRGFVKVCHLPWLLTFRNNPWAQKLHDFSLCVENDAIVIVIECDTFFKAQLNCFRIISFLKYVCNFVFCSTRYCKNVDLNAIDNPRRETFYMSRYVKKKLDR